MAGRHISPNQSLITYQLWTKWPRHYWVTSRIAIRDTSSAMRDTCRTTITHKVGIYCSHTRKKGHIKAPKKIVWCLSIGCKLLNSVVGPDQVMPDQAGPSRAAHTIMHSTNPERLASRFALAGKEDASVAENTEYIPTDGTQQSADIFWCMTHSPRGPGTILKLGGGGQTSPGVQGNHYPKLKTPGFRPLFFGRHTISRAKTNKNKNDIDSPKLEGQRPSGPKDGGQAPPPPRFPGLCTRLRAHCYPIRTINYRTHRSIKGTNPALKKPSNIPEIYAKMFGRFHWSRL